MYLLPEHDRWAKHRIADTREGISDVVNQIITEYRMNSSA
jgi:hypothetical protein